MVDNVWNAVRIAPVGHNADVIPEQNDVATLPFFKRGSVSCQLHRMAIEIHAKVAHAAKVDGRVRGIYVVRFWSSCAFATTSVHTPKPSFG